MEFNKNYLQLDKTQGQFYLYSKDEKSEYKKHESTTGKVTYRKYFDKGVTGTLDSVTIYESSYGKEISFSILDGNNQYYAPIGIFDQRNNINNYAESVIKFLPLLEKKQNILLYPYRFTPEGEKYAKVGVSFTVNGEKIKPALSNSYYNREGDLVPGDIPAIKWVKKLGENKPSAASLEAKDEYLLEQLELAVSRLTWRTDSSAPREENKEEPLPQKPEAKKDQLVTNQQEDEEDDLPF